MPDSIQRAFRWRLLAALSICLALAYVAGLGAYVLATGLAGRSQERPRESQVLWEAWHRIETDFYGPLPSVETRTYGAIRASFDLLDPYTVFLEPESQELEQDQLRGAYGGIGVTVWRDTQGRIVIDPLPLSAAERAGLRRGDVLVAIDGEPMTGGTTVGEVEAQLHGEAGTTVSVTISRDASSELEFTVVRETIEDPSVTWRMETEAIGYIEILRFTERTDAEVGGALEAVEQARARGLVLDLRENPGGLIDSAVAVAGRFLQEGDVVLYQRTRDGERTLQARNRDGVALPLAILVDAQTASAAEILAGALRDHDRAVLIGGSTFGKGSVQEIYGLSNGSAVHVTTAVWITPNRHEIDQTGLTPDIAIGNTDEPGDEQLQRALSYLAWE